jgi:enamine deaminase RidA (YjgF/YER057c/UK114 family)
LYDLKATLAAAGASLADVTLVQIYLTSLDYKPAVDAVYRQSRPGVYCGVCLANTRNGD